MGLEFGGSRTNPRRNVTAIIALGFFAADVLLIVILVLRHTV